MDELSWLILLRVYTSITLHVQIRDDIPPFSKQSNALFSISYIYRVQFLKLYYERPSEVNFSYYELGIKRHNGAKENFSYTNRD